MKQVKDFFLTLKMLDGSKAWIQYFTLENIKINHKSLRGRDHLSVDIPFTLEQLYGVYHNILPAYLLLPLQPRLVEVMKS